MLQTAYRQGCCHSIDFRKSPMILSRRDFTRLALTSAAGMLPHALAQSTERRVGYAIIGLGRISMNCCMPALKASSTSAIAALVSGSPDKARRVAAQYGVPETSIYSYEQFDRIRENSSVEAVYVALPNSMHAEYTIRAARAGKHVLCEKPMATSVDDSKAMIAACKQTSRKLMIGYRCQLEPTTLHARQIIQTGQLGKIQSIESANGFNTPPGEWRLNRKLAGGGPLVDVGIYSLNASRFLLGEEPAFSSVGRFDQVKRNTRTDHAIPLRRASRLRHELWCRPGKFRSSPWDQGHADATAGIFLRWNSDGRRDRWGHDQL